MKVLCQCQCMLKDSVGVKECDCGKCNPGLDGLEVVFSFTTKTKVMPHGQNFATYMHICTSLISSTMQLGHID